MTYKVTLTRRVKLEIEASTPQEALSKAKDGVQGEPFDPDTFSVKEKTGE